MFLLVEIFLIVDGRMTGELSRWAKIIDPGEIAAGDNRQNRKKYETEFEKALFVEFRRRRFRRIVFGLVVNFKLRIFFDKCAE